MTDQNIEDVKPLTGAELAFIEAFVREHGVEIHCGMRYVIATDDGIKEYEGGEGLTYEKESGMWTLRTA